MPSEETLNSLEALSARLTASTAKEDNAAREALVEAMPGPLKVALSPNQEIAVGKWKVGPFRDCHYEWLSQLDHPLAKAMTRELIANVTNKPSWVADDTLWERCKAEAFKSQNAVKSKQTEENWKEFWLDVAERYERAKGAKHPPSPDDTYIPRGPSMWQLAWITTRSPQEVKSAWKSGGKEAVADKAEAEFGGCRMQALMALFGAVSRQMEVYWSTAISHEESEAEKEGGGAPHAPANPSVTSSGPPPTG